MARKFMDEHFLLGTKTAETLYHKFAAGMPIFDYHSHLSAGQIAEDKQFENLTQAWLYGDHYKWRGMRSNGVQERFITGDATDREKFRKWAETVPSTIRNPLYHWTHLELRRYFGITKLLNPETADSIFDACAEKLQTRAFSTRNLLKRMKVRALCTTDDPSDDLHDHKRIRDDGFEVRVLPTFRPDRAMNADNVELWNQYVDKLAKAAGMRISTLDQLVEALDKRHAYFHSMGCRLSDHGLDMAYAEECKPAEVKKIFAGLRDGRAQDKAKLAVFKSAMMLEFGKMDHARGWTQQLHLGALRNNNSRFFAKIGPDTGFDSIDDLNMARPLSRFLDGLDRTGQLPKTILYNLNPRDNAMLAAMIGNFQDGSVAGKMQFGSGWWFLDQKEGMTNQMNALSSMGLLSRFVGMLTDSRSFLSFPRHEYFRRILCDLLGKDMEAGEIPMDMKLIGGMVQDISFRNARNYFGIAVRD